jgi:hypothetical protein
VKSALAARIAATLDRAVDPAVALFAARLADESQALAVLFYGSNLRTGSREGVLDFYVLTGGAAESGLWPRVSYREWDHEGERLRAKIATMTLAMFARAAAGEVIDTTIWARFVQPCALVWCRDPVARTRVEQALSDAAITAAGLAAAVGPETGAEADFWAALFRATYRAELRVEQPGRENSILEANAAHFSGLLGLAWDAGGIAHSRNAGQLRPELSPRARADTLRWWQRRRRMGKPLNIVRLVRASFTFDGAARYIAWKIERHTGLPVRLTPWRERHPLLSAPAVMWELSRAKASRQK